MWHCSKSSLECSEKCDVNVKSFRTKDGCFKLRYHDKPSEFGTAYSWSNHAFQNVKDCMKSIIIMEQISVKTAFQTDLSKCRCLSYKKHNPAGAEMQTFNFAHVQILSLSAYLLQYGKWHFMWLKNISAPHVHWEETSGSLNSQTTVDKSSSPKWNHFEDANACTV